MGHHHDHGHDHTHGANKRYSYCRLLLLQDTW